MQTVIFQSISVIKLAIEITKTDFVLEIYCKKKGSLAIDFFQSNSRDILITVEEMNFFSF